MSRAVWSFLVALTAASLVIALAAIFWRWRLSGLPDPVVFRPRPLVPFILLAVPAAQAIALRVFARRQAVTTERNRRHDAVTLMLGFPLMVASEALMALAYLETPPPGAGDLPRITLVLSGLILAAGGNFIGKLDPPRGRARDPAAWPRVALLTARIAVLCGLACAAGAIFLPKPALLVLLLVVAPILLVAGTLRLRA